MPEREVPVQLTVSGDTFINSSPVNVIVIEGRWFMLASLVILHQISLV